MTKTNNISIENAEIVFKNFSGKAGKYNPEGRRNFCVLLSDDMADQLSSDGWNVRWLEPRDEGASPQAYLQVSVAFEIKPPKILMITTKGQNLLDEKSVGTLDWAEIETVDLVISPYNWEVGLKKGIKAYAKSMYVKLVEDEFENKWVNKPDSAVDSVGGCGNCEACDGSCSHSD